jgi:hypothetical protein
MRLTLGHALPSYIIYLNKDPQSSDRTRHIDGKYKIIQQLVKNEVLSVQWIPTKDMLADALTKQLCAPSFIEARTALGVLEIED